MVAVAIAQTVAAAQRVSTTAVLTALVGVAAGVHALLAKAGPSPWIIPDELIYAELAKSLGEGGLPRIRGEVSFAYGLGYPLLLAPIWAAFDDVTTAYSVARVVNAAVLASTAVPVFFLARHFLTERSSLAVAFLTVVSPPLLYSGTLMTEVALYPAFALALLAITVALERASAAAQLAALAAIGLACSVKSVSAVLFVAYPAAIVLHWWLERRANTQAGHDLRRFRATWIALGGAIAALGIASIVTGAAPHAALGGYSEVLEHMNPTAVPGWFLAHLAELELAVAVIPFVATLIVLARAGGRTGGPGERLFAALAVPVLAFWLGAVGVFASLPFLEIFEYPQNVSRLQGRSTFMLAPLLYLGLLLWLHDRRSGRRALVAVALVALLLPAFIPLNDLDENVRFQALSLVPWEDPRGVVAWPLGGFVVAGALTAVVILSLRRPIPAVVVVAPVVAIFFFVTMRVHPSMQWASMWTAGAAWTTSPTWISEALDDERTQVSVLWAEPEGQPFADLERRHRIVFVGELFNRAVGDVFEIGSPMPYGLPSTRVTLESGRVTLPDGRAAALGDLVLVPCYVHVRGTTVVRDPGTAASLIRPARPIRVSVDDPESCAP